MSRTHAHSKTAKLRRVYGSVLNWPDIPWYTIRPCCPAGNGLKFVVNRFWRSERRKTKQLLLKGEEHESRPRSSAKWYYY